MRHFLDDEKEELSIAESDVNSVFLVYWMSYDSNGICLEGLDRDDCSLIGVYTTRQLAAAAVERARLLPGFKDYPDYFLIAQKELNKDHWTTGWVWG